MRRNDLLQRLRPILLARRANLLRSLEGELLSRTVDDDLYDDGTLSQLSLSESRELDAIDQALGRMRDGSFGLCTECGRRISMIRLQALPYASTCIECQRLSEVGAPPRVVRASSVA
jgi:DnaK suppressor protein